MSLSAPHDRSAADDPVEHVEHVEHVEQNRLRQGLHVRYEFVVLDGEAGKHLARRQAAIMRKVLQHIARLEESPSQQQS